VRLTVAPPAADVPPLSGPPSDHDYEVLLEEETAEPKESPKEPTHHSYHAPFSHFPRTRPLGRPQHHQEFRGTQKNPPRRKPSAHSAHFLAISRDGILGTTNRTHLVDSFAADRLSLTAKQRDWLLRGSA
jgi:hypothetical protein